MPTGQMLVPLRFFYAGYGPVAKSTVLIVFFKLVLFSQCRFSTVVCPRCAPSFGGTTQIGGGTLKKFPALCAGVCAPQLQNRVGAYAPM